MTNCCIGRYLFFSRKNSRRNGFKKRGGLNKTIIMQSSFPDSVLAAFHSQKACKDQQNGLDTDKHRRRQKAGN